MNNKTLKEIKEKIQNAMDRLNAGINDDDTHTLLGQATKAIESLNTDIPDGMVSKEEVESVKIEDIQAYIDANIQNTQYPGTRGLDVNKFDAWLKQQE